MTPLEDFEEKFRMLTLRFRWLSYVPEGSVLQKFFRDKRYCGLDSSEQPSQLFLVRQFLIDLVKKEERRFRSSN